MPDGTESGEPRAAPEMGTVGQKEKKTQQRVVALFRERLGYASRTELERQN